MDRLKIIGGRPLAGRVSISGAKNSALPCMAAALLTAETLAGLKSVWPIYILSALSAAAQAFDTPARQALMPTLVPEEDFPNAVSLGIIVFNIAIILGPAIAGFILAETGPAIIYGFNALSFLAVIGAVIAMRTSGSSHGSSPHGRSPITPMSYVSGAVPGERRRFSSRAAEWIA